VVVFDLAARTAQIIYQYASQGGGWPPAPVWNPDGLWLVFNDSSASENAGLWVARIGGTLETQRLGLGGHPVWSPDGRWLAFQSVAQDGLPVYALAETGTWERQTLDIPVDRYGKLVAWVDLRDGTGSGLTIAGTIRDVAVSARIITLDAPVEDVTTIALTKETRLIAGDGNDIALHDIEPGVRIKAFGQRGEADALIARQVVVLNTNPSDRR
jgi:dipeptidyl aminopeptidase/acylaminoacyl peptidase